MSFDSVDHVDLDWLYPIHALPHGDFTGAGFGEPLRAAYAVARRRARALFSYVQGRDLRTAEQWVLSSAAVPGSMTTLRKFRVLIPASANAIAARVGVIAAGPGATSVFLRLSVNGSPGSQVEVRVPDLATGLSLQAKTELPAAILSIDPGGAAGSAATITIDGWALSSGGGTFGFQVLWAFGFYGVLG